MTCHVATCSYCRGCRVTLRDGPRGWEFGLRYAGATACPHLTFASVTLQAIDETRGGRTVAGRSGAWLWVYGAGLRTRPLAALADPVGAYVDHWCCGLLDAAEVPRVAGYRVVLATAGMREVARPGTGEFPIRGAAGEWLWAVLDSWAVFSPAPAALAAEVDRRSRWPGQVDAPIAGGRP